MSDFEIDKKAVRALTKKAKMLISDLETLRDMINKDDPYLVVRGYAILMTFFRFERIIKDLHKDIIHSAMAQVSPKMPSPKGYSKAIEEQDSLRGIVMAHHPVLMHTGSHCSSCNKYKSEDIYDDEDDAPNQMTIDARTPEGRAKIKELLKQMTQEEH